MLVLRKPLERHTVIMFGMILEISKTHIDLWKLNNNGFIFENRRSSFCKNFAAACEGIAFII